MSLFGGILGWAWADWTWQYFGLFKPSDSLFGKKTMTHLSNSLPEPSPINF
jgi:hypothetical protein